MFLILLLTYCFIICYCAQCREQSTDERSGHTSSSTVVCLYFILGQHWKECFLNLWLYFRLDGNLLEKQRFRQQSIVLLNLCWIYGGGLQHLSSVELLPRHISNDFVAFTRVELQHQNSKKPWNTYSYPNLYPQMWLVLHHLVVVWLGVVVRGSTVPQGFHHWWSNQGFIQ